MAVEQLTNKLTALELDARKAGVAEEGKGDAAAGTGTGKAYLSLEEYKAATAAGACRYCCVVNRRLCLWPLLRVCRYM